MKKTVQSIANGTGKLYVNSGNHINSGNAWTYSAALYVDGNLTVCEPVYKNEYTNVLYASYAIYCKDLTVSGGMFEAAWDWGEYTPIVFPADSYWGYAEPLIKTLNGTASFGGGTVTLDTGCAGNTVLKAEMINLSGGVRGSGYTNENGSDTYIQKDGSMPVKFTVYPANYTVVDTALNKVKTLDKSLYKDFSAVEEAVNAVVRDKNIDEQTEVDAMAKAIEGSVIGLEKKPAETKTEPDDKSPQTGDNRNLMMWIVLLFISGGIVMGTTVASKKKKHSAK